MTNLEKTADGAFRMQPVMFVFILIIGALSFGPLMVSAGGAQQSDAQTPMEMEPDTGYSMTWVVDPDTPGKVKLAAKPRAEARPDSSQTQVQGSQQPTLPQ